MQLQLGISEKTEVERITSIIIIGLLTGLEKGSISIEEAEGYLFNPYSVERLEKLDISSEIIEIIKLGCELEDIESLLPEKLPRNIQLLKERAILLLDSIPRPELPTEKLIK
ncbi:DUF3969 family protein [Aneurinibacillus uraniidurans]|uniref:DUF3969 family protein n=1 Tax=Aneurinibacillus uraniidurans TaxID=2966586 RepID=UPI00234BD055|nr:DUF3969 family protein [Aneurinibacillus sp. B1]WCN36805.1 DUF3969 family protein [Aneurinibacillus sp. B1]